MSKIKIKNFGPIKEGCIDNDGWIEIKKVTTFIGDQGTGKSTVAKLISTFTWIEKVLIREDYDERWFKRKGKFKNLISYHRMESYFHETQGNNVGTTRLEYEGEAYHIIYDNKEVTIKKQNHGKEGKQKYLLPKIMYVPSERNFISYMKKSKELKLSSESLLDFLLEFEDAKNSIQKEVVLPINNTSLEYDKLNDTLSIKGIGYKMKLTDASSGFHSLVPLYIVSKKLSSRIKDNPSFSKQASQTSPEELQRFRKSMEAILSEKAPFSKEALSSLSSLFFKFKEAAFINIVEEPEQNLYPTSQWEMLKSLLEYNEREGNKLIMSTHSPYIINYLNIAIKGKELENKIKELKNNNKTIEQNLEAIIPKKSRVAANDVVVYELDTNGSIKKLKSIYGMLSDENYLNQKLEEFNDEFTKLLEIEDEL